MHDTIKRLLEKGDEESLECLCRLLKSVGKDLEEKGNKTQGENVMDSYFDSMQKIVDEYSRITFILKEVIDLRKNKWIPKKDTDNSTTVDPSLGEAKHTGSIEDRKQDQRSPLDSNRIKQYDRNYLLQLKFQPTSLYKPSNLPNLSEIKDKHQQHFPTYPYGSSNTLSMPQNYPYHNQYTLHGTSYGRYLIYPSPNYTMKNPAQAPALSNQAPKKRIPILDPLTGKDIQESLTEEALSVKEKDLTTKATPQVSALISSNESSLSISEKKTRFSSPAIDNAISSAMPLPVEEKNAPNTKDSDNKLFLKDTTVISNDRNHIDAKEVESKGDDRNKIKYITYREDQWSPLNPEGKRKYDRDFLLQLQTCPMALRKPSNLPNLIVVKDKAHIHRLTKVSKYSSLATQPVYAATTKGNKQGGKKKAKICALNVTIALHKSENPWKPEHKVDYRDENEALFRRIRGILNKLTSRNFETLLKQVKELPMNTMTKLEGAVDLIFQYSIGFGYKWEYIVLYSNMCKKLSFVKMTSDGEKGEISFRTLLIGKIRKKFEEDPEDKLQRAEVLKDEMKCAELQEKLSEKQKKIRMQWLGNIRFMGELFKLGVLIYPTMYECTKKLIALGDEESLDCLYHFLKSVGKEIDKRKIQANIMDSYFASMQKIVDKHLTSSRIRFMLQDMIKLRQNNWILPGDESNHKTSDQIHNKPQENHVECKVS